MNHTMLIIRREYMERVGKKSFIFTTIFVPLLMVALMIVPALVMVLAGGGQSTVLVLDRSAKILPALKSTDGVTFTPCTVPLDSALARTDIDAVLVIPANVVDHKKADLKLYSNGPSPFETEQTITRQINQIVEDQRLAQLNMADVNRILQQVRSDVTITTFRNDKEQQQAASSSASFGVGIAMAVLLEIFLTIYGAMVMNSIIEEKGNRVLELIVSSVKPAQLMMGKIIGITLVAVTQILIWGVLIIAAAAFLVPMLATPELTASLQASDQEDITQALSLLSSVPQLLQQLAYLLLFLIAGFLFYASLFAAVGSSVDNLQDASQLQMVTFIPITVGLVIAMTVATNPTSALAMWTSFIPFTSPMVIMARIPFDIPAWEIWTSLAILVASFIIMVRIAGKIYRVGIFMYGKKPNLSDIIKWARYK